MNQADYELIKKCITYGAPAVAPELMGALNKIVTNSNELERLLREAQAKAEESEIEAQKKDKSEKPKVDSKPKGTK